MDKSSVDQWDVLDEEGATWDKTAIDNFLGPTKNPTANTREDTRTIYVIRELKYCVDNKKLPPGSRWGGCTVPGRSSVVVALGPAPYLPNTVPWLQMEWQVPHELVHTLGFPDFNPPEGPTPDPIPIMISTLPAVTADTKFTLTPDQCRALSPSPAKK